jgi:uncharacterized membrane protein YdjX (TVP38/TMEM64 family)
MPSLVPPTRVVARLRARVGLRVGVALLAMAGALLLALLLSPDLRGIAWAFAAGEREPLRAWLDGLGPLAPLASIGLSVTQAVIAPLPGFIIPYLNGVTFGIWPGALLTWIGCMLGAAACFGLSRTAARPLAAWICERCRPADRAREQVERRMERHGGVTILVLRLIPGAPGDFISYFAGLTGLRWRPFLWGTALGSVPNAIAYSAVGAELALPLWAGIAIGPIVGAAWMAAARLVRRLRRPAPAPSVVAAEAAGA